MVDSGELYLRLFPLPVYAAGRCSSEVFEIARWMDGCSRDVPHEVVKFVHSSYSSHYAVFLPQQAHNRCFPLFAAVHRFGANGLRRSRRPAALEPCSTGRGKPPERAQRLVVCVRRTYKSYLAVRASPGAHLPFSSRLCIGRCIAAFLTSWWSYHYASI